LATEKNNRSFRPKNLCVWRCFCVLLCLFASSAALRAERLPVRFYTSADGLGSSFISSLMRDSRGFLWFCTRDGLSRFDGSRFITYQIGTKDAPPGIESIFETSRGIYWISTTGGLYRFDPEMPAVPPAGDGRPVLNAEFISPARGSFFEDKSGRLWFLGSKLFEVDETGGRFELRESALNLPQNPLIDFAVKAMAEAADGSFWILTTWGLACRRPDGREIFYAVEAANTDASAALVIDRNGRIWVSRQSGVYVLNPETPAQTEGAPALTVRPFDELAQIQPAGSAALPEKPGDVFKFTKFEGFENNLPKILYRSGDGHIWISADGSLIEFDGATFKTYTASQGITGGTGLMTEDPNGNIWIGSPKGLLRLNRFGLTTYNAEDGLKSPYVLVIGETGDGRLFAGGNDFHLHQFNGLNFQTVRPPLPANARALWTSNPIFLDSQNEWWFLTVIKLYRFGAQTRFDSLATARPAAEYDRRNSLRSDQLFHIFEDRRSDLWISTRGVTPEDFHLTRWNRADNSFYTFSSAENFPEKRSVSAFAEDPHGNLWFGLYEGGLVRYANGRFTPITCETKFLDSELVSALHLDKKGRLWISTSKNGLGRIDDLTSERPALTVYNTANGLSSNNVRSLTEDDFGRIYAGTARGIDRLDPETGRIKNYSTNDGLAGDFVQTAFRDRRGHLWFGTPNGLSRLVPVAETASNPPSIRLSGLRIAGENRAVGALGSTELALGELASNQNNLQIEFFGIDFDPGEPLRYQFRLEGADSDWSLPTEQRTVNFSNLSAGNYRFMARAVNADGLTSEKTADISFRILPPVWRRWWFLLLSALLVGGALFAFYRYRLAQLQAINAALLELQRSREERLAELERVRSRIARDLHDDVGSSLTQIALYSEVAKQREKEKTSAAEPLEFLVNVSNELVEAMADIVWAINPRKDHLRDLTQRMRLFASEVLTVAEIDLEFSAPAADEDTPMGANLRREVFLIFKESVNNIVKHANATTTEIDFLVEKDVLTLRLKDNGRGFEPSENAAFDWEKARGGNGLSSMKKRARELGGEYRIESAIGAGTLVVLRVPLGENPKN
jgi:signal transduction histidine kinase/ligand-binding sensor domain-containing protein